MAEPFEQLQELIKKITDVASESEKYRALQQSITALSRKVKAFMEPGDEGWKLLTDEDRNTLLESYDEVGRNIQEYLREVRDQGPDHPNAEANKNVSEMVSTFGNLIREDTAQLRQYDPEKEPKSLPTIYEDARTVTLEANNRKLGKLGNALSSRIPVTINLNGKKVAGVFTAKETYDPAATLKKHFENASALIPAKKRAEGSALLQGLLDSPKTFAEKGSDVLPGEENTPKGKTLAFLKNVLQREADGSYRIPQTKLLRAIGHLSGKTPAQVKKLLGDQALEKLSHDLIDGSIIVNGNAKIPEGADIGIRNVAMSRTADLFGVSDLICKAVPMKLRVGGRIIEGTFMEKADGIDCNHPNDTTDYMDRMPMKGMDPEGLRTAADLQVLDYICGNIDRHAGNMFYQVNLKGKFRGVKGIDNDTSFGKLYPQDRQNHLCPVHQLQLISKEMADKILNTSDDQLRMTLHGLIEEDCIEAAVFRMNQVKKQIELAEKAKTFTDDERLPILPIEKKDFGHPTVMKLINTFKFPNIFAKVANGLTRIATRQNKILAEHPKFGTEVGNQNRATEGGAFSQYDKANLMLAMMKKVTGIKGTSGKFEAMRRAVEEYRDFQAKLVLRMKDAKKKVKAGETDPKIIQDQRISARDLSEMQKKLQKIRDTAEDYGTNKLNDVGGRDHANTYEKRRIDTSELVKEFAEQSLALTDEEKQTLNANSRRTAEEVIRTQNREMQKKNEPVND